MAVHFQTAPTLPTELACRTFEIPNSKEWLGIFNALYSIMINPYNWERVNDTDLTIDESIEIVKEAWALYWENTGLCGEVDGCTLPDLDTPPFRIGLDGHFEILDPTTGEWGTPTGEYEIPPVPEREETTPFDRKCAAATNATHVLNLCYEAITDEIALGGDTLQVAAALVAALVTAVGGWIAAPVYAIIQLSIALFQGIVEILQVLGGDVWTEDFNRKLKCALLECATSVGDVVEFDIVCLKEQLWTEPNITDPDWFYDLQLFAQISYLIDIIGADGLNAAGGTTAITTFDCDDCGGWCYEFDFTISEQGWTPRDNNAIYAAYIGTGWRGVNGGTGYNFGVERLFTDVQLTRIEWDYTFTVVPAGGWGIELYNDNVYQGGYVLTAGDKAAATHNLAWDFTTTPIIADEVRLAGSSGGGQPGTNHLTMKCRLYGNGDNPFGDDNC